MDKSFFVGDSIYDISIQYIFMKYLFYIFELIIHILFSGEINTILCYPDISKASVNR